MENILGYLGAISVGLTLGFLGGGGSILTVPVLVYLFAVDPVLSTAYSLFVVGATAFIGAIRKMIRSEADVRIAVLFSIPSLISVYCTRRWVLPSIPEQFEILGISMLKENAILVLFAILMVVAGISMLRSGQYRDRFKSALNTTNGIFIIIVEGLVLGLLTGLVGAGGGFMIIPILVLSMGMDMKTAIGTSLIIIAIKSLVGFVGDIQTGQFIEWNFLLIFTGLSIIGLYIGDQLSKKTASQNLKQLFGVFLIVLAIAMTVKEVFVKKRKIIA